MPPIGNSGPAMPMSPLQLAGTGISPLSAGGINVPLGGVTQPQLLNTLGTRGGGANVSASGIVPGMQDVYNQLLGLNQQNYANVLGAFNNASSQLGGSLGGIYPQYGNVLSGVENTLGMGQVLGQNGNWGVAGPAAQAIADTFQQTSGAAQAALIGSGLGNTTNMAGVLNQAGLQAGRAYAGLGSQLAQTAAGYQANIGLAGLGAQLQGAGMQSGLAQAGFGDLARYQFGNTAGNLTGGFGSGYYQGPLQSGFGGGGAGGMGNQDIGPASDIPYPQIQGDPYGQYGGGGVGTPIGSNMDAWSGGFAANPAGGSSWGFGYDPYGNMAGLNSGMSGAADTFANYNGYPMGPYGGGFQTTNYGNLGNLGMGGFGGGFGSYGDMTGLDSNLGYDLNALIGDTGGFDF